MKASGYSRGFQFVEKPVQNKIRLSQGGGARGGGSPPRVGSNALNALLGKAFSERSEDLLGKAFSERSEDFCTAQRRKSNGIFQAVGKVLGLFRQPESLWIFQRLFIFPGKQG